MVGNNNKVDGCYTADSLQKRTKALASYILEFIDDRHDSLYELRARMMAQNMIDTSRDDPTGAERLQEQLRRNYQETQNLFQDKIWPQVVSLQNDLVRADVDITPIARALATDGPRKIALMLSVLGERIGQKPPYPRVITPVEIKAIFPRYDRQTSHVDLRIEVYGYLGGKNSSEIASKLISGLQELGWVITAYFNYKPKANGTFNFAGEVIAGTTERPVVGATVTVAADQRQPETIRTDSHGLFNAQVASDTRVLLLTVNAPGYITASVSANPHRTGPEIVILEPTAKLSPIVPKGHASISTHGNNSPIVIGDGNTVR